MNDARPGRRPRVFIHVGSPKTGTTFLQNVLWSQRELAAEQGLLLPLDRFGDHYLASLDVRGLSGRPEHPARARGIWQRVVRESLAHDGNVLISHELFAAATAAQARTAVEAFGDDAEVHVVLTVRDLVRQLTAEWQEHVKHRSTSTFGDFVRSVREDADRRSWFWRVQDFPAIAQRWARAVPAERVHVVVVPPAGSPGDVLWGRFAGLLGLDPTSFDLAVGHSNTSLGVEQAELLRRVNLELGDRLPLPGPYPGVVKNLLAHRILAAHRGQRLALDPADARFGLEASRAMAQRLGAMGADVIGSLDELVPDDDVLATATEGAYDPPADERLLAESVAVVADLLVVVADLRRVERRHRELVERLDAAPVRTLLVRASERRPALARMRRAYRAGRSRLRGDTDGT